MLSQDRPTSNKHLHTDTQKKKRTKNIVSEIGRFICGKINNESTKDGKLMLIDIP